MNGVARHSTEQARWDHYGADRLKAIEEHPDRWIIRQSPLSSRSYNRELISLLSPLRGKRILELGCGAGEMSVFLSKQGAQVTGIDMGPSLIAAARTLARLNEADCVFQQCNVVSLPLESETYDVVIGLHILHHLSQSDVLSAVQESSRVLKRNGIAVFVEPIENSKFFSNVQNIFPAGKRGSSYYRPPLWRRAEWKEYVRALDDRDMTHRELILAGSRCFSTTRISAYGFLIRLERLLGGRYQRLLSATDTFLFKVLPPLRHFDQVALVQYRK